MDEHLKNKASDRSIKFGLVLNTTYTIIEFTFGILTGSLALIADAAHNLTDTFTLSISYIANKIARRDANESKSFGYGRATILAALLNSSVMLAIAGFIGFEAIQRFRNPVEIEGGVVAVVASIGILVNGSIAYVLSKQKQDLNMKSAYIDMTFDTLSSLGAVVAGLLIMLTGVHGIDSAVGLIIAALLLFNAYKILVEATQILLEGTPKNIDVVALTEAIKNTEKVLDVDDLHVWAIRSGYNALSCHIAIDEEDLKESLGIVKAVKTKLRDELNIQHATIEVELESNISHDIHDQH